ncbi:Amuc_1100 family pilus-like protein [Rariglobus hedericola]|uniref:Uncharacterized protein n=1 Tax=Rariglobus hedericola TaxID=2597822 RepID=A0A556QQB6_9BACT|nr:Amuc_1100 family pilus-like protein [Rariglobus hedericola]TSJ78837.1 hypothetical protein FPL22_05895 [Rariglobus hedericola]
MASFKSNPIYCSVLGVLGLAVLAAGWGIYDRHAASEKSAALLVQKRNELNSLQAVNPAPSEVSKAAVEADLLRTEAALVKMRAELKGSGPFAEALRNTPAPSEPTDVFFNLETFVEKTRQKAEAAKVKIKADERFGFYTYDRTGPDRDLIPQVFKQRQVIEYLVDALIEATPSELLAVNRERPLTKAALAAIAAGQPAPQSSASAANSNSTNNDFFDIDPRISARVPGFVGASAFRLTFVSETESLRVLLNKLASFELPLVVRSVEVEPMPKSQSSAAPVQSNSLSSIFGNAPSSTPAAAPEPKPLVEKVLSKFTVTVELIDLIEAPATEATPTS